MAVRIADRHVVAAVVVLLIDRHDPLRREAVDRGEHRGLDQAAVGEGEEVEAVVDQVELPGPLEDRGDVQPLFHLGIEIGVVGVARWARSRPVGPVVTESAVANRVTSTPRAPGPR